MRANAFLVAQLLLLKKYAGGRNLNGSWGAVHQVNKRLAGETSKFDAKVLEPNKPIKTSSAAGRTWRLPTLYSMNSKGIPASAQSLRVAPLGWSTSANAT